MKFSNLFTRTSRDVPTDETSNNAKLLIKAGFVNKTMAGVYSYLPLGLRVLDKIENIIRSHINSIGGQEVLLNSLHPKEWWNTTDRWDSVDILFKLSSQTEREYALACSHEEQVTPVVSNFIKSWKDLPEYEPGSAHFPLSVYQIQTKFRDELRSKSGLLRGREFRMKDMYDFHATKSSQDAYYDLVKSTYFKIFNEMGLQAYAVHASGGIFTNNDSHEFQVICSAGEDDILYDEKSGFAINLEVYDELTKTGASIPNNLARAVSAEVGNIFKLDDKYTKAFNVSFTDSSNNKLTPFMNCHGIGTSRCMGVIAEIYSDEKGLKWPETVAPFMYHLITNSSQDEKINLQIMDIAHSIYLRRNKKFDGEVLWDDRINISIGQKLKDADLIGCPFQLVISERSIKSGGIEMINRSTGVSTIVTIS